MNWQHFDIKRNLCIESFVSAFEQEFEPGFVFKGESHNFWEMLYVEKGTVCISADEKVFNLEQNQIVFHKPMELHKFHIEEGNSATAFIMSFSLSGNFAARLEKRALTLAPHQKSFLENIIDFVRKFRPDCYDFGHGMLLNLNNSPATVHQLSCMTEIFLLSLVETQIPVSDISDTTEIIIFKDCVKFMEESIYDWISVPELAEKCKVSVSYLKKIFSRYAGFGIHKYFLKTKINLASQLLKQGKTVGEVASILSFSSQNYFSMVFKRETGVSPLNFKNE